MPGSHGKRRITGILTDHLQNIIMKRKSISINFKGGVISPGELLSIIKTIKAAGIAEVSFGLRQQLIVSADQELMEDLEEGLQKKRIAYESLRHARPNVVSSYPAAEIFIKKSWLGEGVYKDVFDAIDYSPALKVNICDSRQSLAPILTGNINWVASDAAHFWYLIVRFPKTNTVFQFPHLFYTSDLAQVSRRLEKLMLDPSGEFFNNEEVNGKNLDSQLMDGQHFISKTAENDLVLPRFSLPYYEGFSRYQDKYWLGIYRRDEAFPVGFLYDLCAICLHTKIGQVCATPWKSLIVKGIEEKDKHYWDNLLAKHLINVRHAANELNFQVEDDCPQGLAIKQKLVKFFSEDDTRTFGIAIGIKTRPKSEVFSSILIRQRSLFRWRDKGYFNRYDILIAKDYNPNERTAIKFASGLPKFLLAEQARRAIIMFYRQKQSSLIVKETRQEKPGVISETNGHMVHQCSACGTVYDPAVGDVAQGIAANTSFMNLPVSYLCPLCEAGKEEFVARPMHVLINAMPQTR